MRPRRHQDQRHHGAARRLPHRRRGACPRRGERRRRSRRRPRHISSICRKCRSRPKPSSPTSRRSTPSSGAARSPSAKASATRLARRSAPKLMRGPGEVDAHGNVQLSGSGALGDGLADLVKRGLDAARRQGAARARRHLRLYPALLAASLAVDAEEARAVGRFAAALAAKGDRSASVIILRTSIAPDSYAAPAGVPISRRWRGAAAMCRLSSSQAPTM